MKYIITALLISLSLSSHAQEIERVLLSDSTTATGHHRLHILKSQLERSLTCAHLSADFVDTEPDVTQVLFRLDGVAAPNVMMRGHYPSMFVSTVDKELCEKIERIKEQHHPNNFVPYSFKVFLVTQEDGHQVLEEEVTLELHEGIQLKSVQRRLMFQ